MVQKIGEIDQFVAKIKRIGGSLFILIPNNQVTFSELKEKQILKIWFKILKRK